MQPAQAQAQEPAQPQQAQAQQQPAQPQAAQSQQQPQPERSNSSTAPKYKGQDVVSGQRCCGTLGGWLCAPRLEFRDSGVGGRCAWHARALLRSCTGLWLLLGPRRLPLTPGCCCGCTTLLCLSLSPQRRQHANGPDASGSNGPSHWVRNNRQQGWGGEPLANSSSAPDGQLVSGRGTSTLHTRHLLACGVYRPIRLRTASCVFVCLLHISPAAYVQHTRASHPEVCWTLLPAHMCSCALQEGAPSREGSLPSGRNRGGRNREARMQGGAYQGSYRPRDSPVPPVPAGAADSPVAAQEGATAVSCCCWPACPVKQDSKSVSMCHAVSQPA